MGPKVSPINTQIKNISALILTIANAAKKGYVYTLIIPPLFGSLFGLVAGVIGIRLSYVSEIKQMKCLWISFIILVCKVPFVFGYILIFSAFVHPLLQL